MGSTLNSELTTTEPTPKLNIPEALVSLRTATFTLFFSPKYKWLNGEQCFEFRMNDVMNCYKYLALLDQVIKYVYFVVRSKYTL